MRIYLLLFCLCLLGLLSTGCVDDSGQNRLNNVLTPSKYSSVDDTDTGTSPSTLTRPDQAITIVPESVCACNGTNRVSYNNCDAACAQYGGESGQLFIIMNFTVDDIIALNEGLQDTRGWCTQAIVDPDTGEQIDGGNPGCAVEAINQNNDSTSIPVTFTDFVSGNLLVLQTSATTLSSGDIWRLDLVELSSNASTKGPIHLYIEELTEEPILGDTPLKISLVHQYGCLSVGFSTDGNIVYSDNAFVLNYYYTDNTSPSAIPPSSPGVVCHDNTQYPDTDNAEYPRSRLKEGMFRTWSVTDPRFYDNDGVDGVDINHILGDKLREITNNLGQADPEIFFPLTWPNMPEISGSSQTVSSPSLGYVMTPFIDLSTLLSYCPGNDEYNRTTNSLFQVLKTYIGIETEGLYLALREPLTTTDRDGNIQNVVDNYILVRESLLKKIWFYIENQQKFIPNENNVANKTIRFYWPANVDQPLVQSSEQYLYTIYYPTQLQAGPGQNVDTSLNDPYPPHDRKFACIPKTDEAIY